MYTLISGSPKVGSSNTINFLKMIGTKIEKYNFFELKKDNYGEIINSIRISDVIVLGFPLYVDSPSSILLDFLDYIVDNKILLKEKIVYVVINCGFREGKHNITATNIIKRWCKKVNAIYAASLLIGAGEIVGKEKYKFISHNAMKTINKFADNVRHKKICKDLITTMDLINNRFFCFIANLFWDKSGKKNNLSSSDLRIK